MLGKLRNGPDGVVPVVFLRPPKYFSRLEAVIAIRAEPMKLDFLRQAQGEGFTGIAALATPQH